MLSPRSPSCCRLEFCLCCGLTEALLSHLSNEAAIQGSPLREKRPWSKGVCNTGWQVPKKFLAFNYNCCICFSQTFSAQGNLVSVPQFLAHIWALNEICEPAHLKDTINKQICILWTFLPHLPLRFCKATVNQSWQCSTSCSQWFDWIQWSEDVC